MEERELILSGARSHSRTRYGRPLALYWVPPSWQRTWSDAWGRGRGVSAEESGTVWVRYGIEEQGCERVEEQDGGGCHGIEVRRAVHSRFGPRAGSCMVWCRVTAGPRIILPIVTIQYHTIL